MHLAWTSYSRHETHFCRILLKRGVFFPRPVELFSHICFVLATKIPPHQPVLITNAIMAGIRVDNNTQFFHSSETLKKFHTFPCFIIQKQTSPGLLSRASCVKMLCPRLTSQIKADRSLKVSEIMKYS